MKKKLFACPKLMLFALFPRALILFAPLLFIVQDKIALIVASFIFYTWTSAIAALIYRKAFCVVEIDADGIKSGRTRLFRDGIGPAGIVTVELFKYNLCPTVSIELLCLSEAGGEHSFFKASRGCIFLSATEKNVRGLKDLWGEDAVRILGDIAEWYR